MASSLSLLNALSELLPRISVISPEIIRVTGNDSSTVLEAQPSKNPSVWVHATLKAPFDDFSGKCGINNIPLLQGLLDFECYRQESSSMHVIKNAAGINPYKIVFTDTFGETSEVILMDESVIPSIARIKNAAVMDLSFTPDMDRIKEFGKLARLYADSHKYCILYTKENNLIAKLGTAHDIGTNTGSYVIAENVEGQYNDTTKQWCVSDILDILRINALTDKTISLNVKHSYMNICVESTVATYNYYIRANTI